jgi:Predicted metal-binding protein
LKQIAILSCLQANDVCAGAACMRALNERKEGFERYRGEEVRLCAFMRCSRCHSSVYTDQGMEEKMHRLLQEGVDTVHIGICAFQKEREALCTSMAENVKWLEEHGICVVWGTHSLFPPQK